MKEYYIFQPGKEKEAEEMLNFINSSVGLIFTLLDDNVKATDWVKKLIVSKTGELLIPRITDKYIERLPQETISYLLTNFEFEIKALKNSEIYEKNEF